MADNKKISELVQEHGMPDDSWFLVLAKTEEDNYKITFKDLAEKTSDRAGAVMLAGDQNIAGIKDFSNLKFGGKIVGTEEREDDILLFAEGVSGNLDLLSGYVHVDLKNYIDSRDDAVSGYLVGYSDDADALLEHYVDNVSGLVVQLDSKTAARDAAISGYVDAISGKVDIVSGDLQSLAQEVLQEHAAIYQSFQDADIAVSGYAKEISGELNADIEALAGTIGGDVQAIYGHIEDVSGFLTGRDDEISGYVDLRDDAVSGYLTGFAVAKDIELSGALKQYVDENTEWDEDLSGYVDFRDDAVSGYLTGFAVAKDMELSGYLKQYIDDNAEWDTELSGYVDLRDDAISGYLTGFAVAKDIELSGYVDSRDDAVSGYIDSRESTIRSYVDTRDNEVSGYLTGFAVAKDLELSGVLKQYVDDNTEWDTELSGYVDSRDNEISGYLTGFAVQKDIELSGYLTGYIDSELKDIDLTDSAVLLTGAQTVSGVKTFVSGMVASDIKLLGDISGVGGSTVMTDGSDPDLISAPDKSLALDFEGGVYITGTNLNVDGAIKTTTLETHSILSLEDIEGENGSMVLTDGSDPDLITAPDKSLTLDFEGGVYITGATSELFIESAGGALIGKDYIDERDDAVSGYVDSALEEIGPSDESVLLTGEQTISGSKTFESGIIASDIKLLGDISGAGGSTVFTDGSDPDLITAPDKSLSLSFEGGVYITGGQNLHVEGSVIAPNLSTKTDLNSLSGYVDTRDDLVSGYADIRDNLVSGYVDSRESAIRSYSDSEDEALSGYLTGYIDDALEGVGPSDEAVLLTGVQIISGSKTFESGIIASDIKLLGDISGAGGSTVFTDGSDPDLIIAPDKSLALDFEGGVYVTGSDFTVDGTIKTTNLETHSILSLEDIEGEDGSMVITDGSDPDLIEAPDKSLALDFEGGVYVTGSDLIVDGNIKTTTLETHSLISLEDIEGEDGSMVMTDGADPDLITAPDKSLSMDFDGGVYITGSDLSVEGSIHAGSVLADNIESAGDIVIQSSNDDGLIDGSIILTDGQDPTTIGAPDNTLSFYFASGVFVGPVRLLPDDFVEISNSNYEALLTDRVIGVDTTSTDIVSAGGCLVTMPETSTLNPGQMFSVKDIGGSGSTYPITVSGHPGQMIDGTLTLAVDNDYSLAQLFTDKQNWYIM